LEAYFQRLKVFHIKDTRAIAIQFSSADPKLAAAVANKLSEIYLQAQKTVAVKQTKGARDWLSGEIKKLRKQVSVAEQTAATFRAKAGLLKGSQGNTTLNAQQLSDLNTELSRARVRKSEAEANAKSAREMLRSGTADSAPDILKSQIIQGLVQQRARLERQISELSATLLPAHPRMRQLSADLIGLKRQVRQAVSTIVSGLEKEARVAGLRLASIQTSLDALKQRAANSGGSQIELAALEREAKSKRELLEAYLQQFSDANARRTLKSVNVNAEIYDRAVPTSRPSFPKKVPLTLLSMAAAVLLGLGAVITRALLAGPRALQAQPDVTTARLTAANDTEVGIAHEPQTSQPGYEQPFPYPATSIERLAHLNSIASVSRDLLERGQDRSGFRTMIVGTSLQSDCAADVIELADQLSQAGKQVLIVDWAPAGHELFKTCHLDLTKGLADLATGAAVFEDVIHGLPGKKAHIICAGTSADQAKMLQDTDCLNLIFDALDETYDHILAYGPFNSARNLFTAMQGRFDTGLLVSDRTDEGVGMAPIAGFLGYDIPDLEIIHFERGGAEHPITMPAANDKHLAAS
jgi:succinoglycan biosynthesis transport protein ExoP